MGYILLKLQGLPTKPERSPFAATYRKGDREWSTQPREVVPFARRNLTELRIARHNLASSEQIMRQISHDIEIVLPTEIELPVAMDRP